LTGIWGRVASRAKNEGDQNSVIIKFKFDIQVALFEVLQETFQNDL
jgi:hypothetical protein